MSRPVTFALGLVVGALAYPLGVLIGHATHHRSVIYPHR
jgi:hypothetical protein